MGITRFPDGIWASNIVAGDQDGALGGYPAGSNLGIFTVFDDFWGKQPSAYQWESQNNYNSMDGVGGITGSNIPAGVGILGRLATDSACFNLSEGDFWFVIRMQMPVSADESLFMGFAAVLHPIPGLVSCVQFEKASGSFDFTCEMRGVAGSVSMPVFTATPGAFFEIGFNYVQAESLNIQIFHENTKIGELPYDIRTMDNLHMHTTLINQEAVVKEHVLDYIFGANGSRLS